MPASTLPLPGERNAQPGFGHRPNPAMAPPAASPWTKRLRDWKLPVVRPDELDDMGTPISMGRRSPSLRQEAEQCACEGAPEGARRHLADRRSDQVRKIGGCMPRGMCFGLVLATIGMRGQDRRWDGRMHAMRADAQTGAALTAVGRVSVVFR